MPRWLLASVIMAMLTAIIANALDWPIYLSFGAPALCLIGLSVILGKATTQLSNYVGPRTAGLVEVSLSNLAELIIIFNALNAGMLDLVLAGIMGSMLGNLLLIQGLSSFVACKRRAKIDQEKIGTLPYSPAVSTLYVTQLFVATILLSLPTICRRFIPDEREMAFSNILAVMLVLSYVFYYWLSFHDARFKEVAKQARALDHEWSKKKTIMVILAAGLSTFAMSKILVGQVEAVSLSLDLSPFFLGFVLLPILGNLSEQSVAVVAAYQQKAELSLSISLGSASQVSLVIAPAAVLFSNLTGNPLTLQFSVIALIFLFASFTAVAQTMKDHRYNPEGGPMLITCYVAFCVGLYFMR